MWLKCRALLATLFILSCGSAHTHANGSGADEDAAQAVLSTFEQINQVPRCSKDEGRISAWLVAWARARNLAVTSDENRNVLISVPSSRGWEARPGVVLQAHMDMVCLKADSSTHDFTKDPIPLLRDGDWIHAEDTTLGADNGIGIALALTVAENPPAQHPKLELLFTADEEKDMSGAAKLSPNLLTGKRLINLDSESDDVVTLGAAGGLHTELRLPLDMSPLPPGMSVFRISLSGLLGGHSGMDINKDRANAISLLAQLLKQPIPFRLLSIQGGNADNVIAASAEAVIAVEADAASAFREHVAAFSVNARERLPAEKGLSITLVESADTGQAAAQPTASAEAMALINDIPQGVTTWSTEFPGLPETSNNIGIVSTEGGVISIATFQRSFHAESLEALAMQIAAAAKAAGAESSRKGAFPGWPPKADSALHKAVSESYLKLFGSQMAADVVHAGLECGYIAEKYPTMEIVSIGPTLEDVHSTRERLKISSVARTWSLLQDVLQAP